MNVTDLSGLDSQRGLKRTWKATADQNTSKEAAASGSSTRKRKFTSEEKGEKVFLHLHYCWANKSRYALMSQKMLTRQYINIRSVLRYN